MSPLKPRPVRIAVDPANVVGQVDERIYGHFLEHIYHSVNGGLWGEMVWDRSFEDPPSPGCPGASGGWQTFGRGKFEVSSEDPLNSERCQMIAALKGEAGVEQTPFFIEKGRTYHGSLYARGTSAKLTVRLMDGKQTLASVRLGPPSGRWKRLSFVLRPRTGAENATLRIGVPAGSTIWIDQVSVMSDAARRAGGFRPDLLKAIADLKPPTIRWPGGSFTCWYRWKDAVGPQHRRTKYPARMWDDQDVNSFGTDEFIALCRRVGAQPVICIRINPSEPKEKWAEFLQDACDWIEYCNGPAASTWGKVRAANGHPKPYNVRYWEIGNEVWGLRPKDYAALLKRFAPVMKKADPSISIISCGSGQLGKYWGRGDGAVISECAHLVDYHSVHHYEEAEKFAEGPAKAERFFRRLGRRIAGSRNPNLKLYVSEWNAQSTDWRTGLYAGGILNVFERNSDIVPMACPALFLRHVSATGWDNAFINFDHKTWFPAPNYVVMKLWRDHFAPLRIETRGGTRRLNTIATKSKDGSTVHLKAVNPGNENKTVELTLSDSFPVTRASMQLVAPGGLCMRNMLGDPARIHADLAPVQTDGQRIRFTLPRWSAGVVSVRT